jgi:transposase-like protein
MLPRDRDRLVVLKNVQKKLITRRVAAQELGVSERQIRRLMTKLKEQGDKAVIHGLRGRRSNRRWSEERREPIVRILSQDVYRGFGPTLASEYLARRHSIQIGREALRKVMLDAGLWRARKQKQEPERQWRERKSRRGEMVQWDTSEHDWLEGRGEKLYLIHMIDDATSELTARFVRTDSTEENLRLLGSYLERHGRPLSFYTDKASLFRTAPKTARDQSPIARDEREPLPPTQIGRALQELQIAWLAAHSPQAKGRVERSFGTAQDRLVKGLRVAGVKSIEEANRYLEEQFLPWWNQHLTVAPGNPADAHRALDSGHHLGSALSRVETRQGQNDYTIRLDGKIYQIARNQIRPGLRGGNVRIEKRLDGSLAVRFRDQYLTLTECQAAAKAPAAKTAPSKGNRDGTPSPACLEANRQFSQRPAMPVWAAAQIDRTRTRDTLD